jgi:hypothetical protein
MKGLNEIKKTLRVSRGKKSRYHIEIEFKGKNYGMGFDDAHFWDALNDLEDTSYYDDVQLTAVEKIMDHHKLTL